MTKKELLELPAFRNAIPAMLEAVTNSSRYPRRASGPSSPMRRNPSRISSIALTEYISDVRVFLCGDRKDSVAWIRASIADVANGLYGRVSRNFGIMTTLFGMISSDTRPSFVSPPVRTPSFSSSRR